MHPLGICLVQIKKRDFPQYNMGSFCIAPNAVMRSANYFASSNLMLCLRQKNGIFLQKLANKICIAIAYNVSTEQQKLYLQVSMLAKIVYSSIS